MVVWMRLLYSVEAQNSLAAYSAFRVRYPRPGYPTIQSKTISGLILRFHRLSAVGSPPAIETCDNVFGRCQLEPIVGSDFQRSP